MNMLAILLYLYFIHDYTFTNQRTLNMGKNISETTLILAVHYINHILENIDTLLDHTGKQSTIL